MAFVQAIAASPELKKQYLNAIADNRITYHKNTKGELGGDLERYNHFRFQ